MHYTTTVHICQNRVSHCSLHSLVKQVRQNHLWPYEGHVMEGDCRVHGAVLAEYGHPQRGKKTLDKVIDVLVCELGLLLDDVLVEPALLLRLLTSQIIEYTNAITVSV